MEVAGHTNVLHIYEDYIENVKQPIKKSVPTKFYYDDFKMVEFREAKGWSVLGMGHLDFVGLGMIFLAAQGSGYTNLFFFGKKHNDDVKKAYDYIQKRLQEIKKAKSAPQMAQASNADELVKYKRLLDTGVITQAEFDTKKKQLLGL